MAQRGRAAVGRPPTADLGLLTLAVVGISTSAPLIAATTAPVLAIAAWRCLLAAVATGPVVAWRQRAEIGRLSPRITTYAAVSGLTLAAHFAFWMTSLRFTSVASSTALVATQPVWAALIARRSGRDVPRRAWLGIGIALLGAFVLTGVDYSVSGRALFGDGLALVGALLAAAYVTIGEQVRRELSTATYTLIAYSASAVALFIGCLLAGSAISGYSSSDWWKIIALTAAAQLLGHTLISRVLRTTSATVTSLAILFEMPGATLVAAIWLGQVPSIAIWPAVALLFAGLSLVIASGDRETLLESPPG